MVYCYDSIGIIVKKNIIFITFFLAIMLLLFIISACKIPNITADEIDVIRAVERRFAIWIIGFFVLLLFTITFALISGLLIDQL